MRSRAELIRSRLADLVEPAHVTEISLGSDMRLPQDYEAAHALGFSYRLDDLPSEEQLTADLRGMVAIYRALTFRGGIDAVDENVRSDIPADLAIIERRRYRLHRRIERNPAAGTLVKKHFGCSCQACGMNFKERYGQIGEGFIEAHHLLPLSSLQEGTVIDQDRLCSSMRKLSPNDPSLGRPFRPRWVCSARKDAKLIASTVSAFRIGLELHLDATVSCEWHRRRNRPRICERRSTDGFRNLACFLGVKVGAVETILLTEEIFH